MRDEDQVWKALSDPTRRKILDLLNQNPRTTSELAASFQLSRFAVMKHLAVLEEVGLVKVRRQGRERWNHFDAAPLSNVYARWISQKTAWTPTIEGRTATHEPSEPPSPDGEPEPELLKEIQLIIRPEEKYAVERALQSVVPPVYATMSALGRGGHEERADRRWSWKRKRQLAAFLPKTIFVLVVPEGYVEPILRAVRAALRLAGGPEDCGTGFAIVSPIADDLVVGAAAAAPETRAIAEGWA